MRHIKSLSALRTFEAAARQMSFKSAAEELFVTPTAVSHQIRSLESHLDCPLFERKTRQVVLTREGHALYTTVRQAFDSIEETTKRISTHTTRENVVLGLGPIIGARWLAPRLGGFWAEHNNIDLRLHHSPLPIHQRIEQCDLAIAWGDGRWPNMEIEHLFDIEVTPVYAPGNLFDDNAVLEPGDLLVHPLVHQRDRNDWKMWFKAAGLPLDIELGGALIEDANMVLQTALNGQAVALGILPFVNEDIEKGQLIRPFPLSVNPGKAYYLIYRKAQMKKKRVKAVRDWILRQVSSRHSARR